MFDRHADLIMCEQSLLLVCYDGDIHYQENIGKEKRFNSGDAKKKLSHFI